jgi:hypothetical protein
MHKKLFVVFYMKFRVSANIAQRSPIPYGSRQTN